MRQPSWIRARSPRTVVCAAAAAFLASAFVLQIYRTWEDRRHLVTGRARWIWATREITEEGPLRFSVSKEFSLPGHPSRAATARIFVDERYVLRVNGVAVASGGQRAGDPLDVRSVWLRDGSNRISIEASSRSGAGGILFWLDPGTGCPIVSDQSWELETASRTLPGGGRHAKEWGAPPMYPWGYPPLPRASDRSGVWVKPATDTRAWSPALAAAQ